ncbi:MAG: alpha-isopropylmalate synthase regulatory domain-containing protein [Bacteroidales bacterium]
MVNQIQILDTTLRDGEQTSGVSFTVKEKRSIAELLLQELRVDRIEIASARVSEGEFNAAKSICDWARNYSMLDRVEILGFVDGYKSIEWIKKAGGTVCNLLCKGSLNHLTHQLRKTVSQHIEDIRDFVDNAHKENLSVNVYLEDWSNGIRQNAGYVEELVNGIKDIGIKRFMLPDTLGVLTPPDTSKLCRWMLDKFSSLKFDFHAHNDYGLAVANVMAAIEAGIDGIHTTINGLGERAGNAPLSSVIGIVNDHIKIKNNIDETKLNNASRLVELFSGIRVSPNTPIIGENVFTQCSGVHADGDHKNNLYFNELMPERFGRTRVYALGKTSGKANIKKNLENIGISLSDEDLQKVTRRVIELGDKKESVSAEDLPYIVSDVLKNDTAEHPIQLSNYSVSSTMSLRSSASVALSINDTIHEASASGQGQYDAFMRAIKDIYSRIGKDFPELQDYCLTIPPGGKADALVETVITWSIGGKVFKTKGLDSDQTCAAVNATIKMLNIIELDSKS